MMQLSMFETAYFALSLSIQCGYIAKLLDTRNYAQGTAGLPRKRLKHQRRQ